MQSISLETIFFLDKKDQDFIKEYIDMISSFENHVYGVEKCSGNPTPVKNTDLWIEANIGKYPGLEKFRKHVRSEMERIGIDRYPDFIYSPENNHYY